MFWHSTSCPIRGSATMTAQANGGVKGCTGEDWIDSLLLLTSSSPMDKLHNNCKVEMIHSK